MFQNNSIIADASLASMNKQLKRIADALEYQNRLTCAIQGWNYEK